MNFPLTFTIYYYHFISEKKNRNLVTFDQMFFTDKVF